MTADRPTPSPTSTPSTPSSPSSSPAAPASPSAAADRRRPRPRRGGLLAATLVLSAVAASAAASAALSEEAPVPLENEMQAEIDAMVDAGVDPDDPKVEMLEESLDQLEEGADADPPTERGVDVEGLLEEAADDEAAEDAAVEDTAAATRSAGPGAVAADGSQSDGDVAWETGEILCEVVPGRLGPDEIAGARCASVPQPDGTSRYVAISPDGTVRSVAFGHDGQVERLADSTVGAPVPRAAAVAATPEGDLVVTAPGQAPRPVDLR